MSQPVGAPRTFSVQSQALPRSSRIQKQPTGSKARARATARARAKARAKETMTEKCLKSLFDEEAPERGCRTPSVFDLTSFRELRTPEAQLPREHRLGNLPMSHKRTFMRHLLLSPLFDGFPHDCLSHNPS